MGLCLEKEHLQANSNWKKEVVIVHHKHHAPVKLSQITKSSLIKRRHTMSSFGGSTNESSPIGSPTHHKSHFASHCEKAQSTADEAEKNHALYEHYMSGVVIPVIKLKHRKYSHN